MELRDLNIAVVDLETTGFDPEEHMIVEIGVISIYYVHDDEDSGVWVIGATENYLVNPQRSIPSVSKAVHHITEDMVKGKPTIDVVVPSAFKRHIDVFFAHNAEFDASFASKYTDDKPWLCSMRLAQKILPDMPSYKNQVLMYELDIPRPAGDPHRAGYDAEVTAYILVHMLEKLPPNFTLEELQVLINSPNLLTGKVGFGKYKDYDWSELPPSYLSWMKHKASGWSVDQMHTINHWYAKRCT